MRANTISDLMRELEECRHRQCAAARKRDWTGFKQEHRHEIHILNKIKELRGAKR